MKRGRNVVLAVMLSLLALAAAPAYAATISSFVTCLKNNATTISSAVACVPAGCYTTVTLSDESAQPGCTLRDGTRLPRVIFSCPGSAPTNSRMHFRPSFTLCTLGGAINHIEVGEDVNRRTGSDDPEIRNFPYVQKMGDIDSSLGFSNLMEFGTYDAFSVVSVPGNSKGCAECHDRKGTTLASGTTVNLFGPVPPAVAEGTIYTNDPDVDPPANQTPLSQICDSIKANPQFTTSAKLQQAWALCDALNHYQP